MKIDRQSLGGFASRTKPGLDSDATTTAAHEIYHARDALCGKPQQFCGRRQTNFCHGSSGDIWQCVRREKKDVSKSEARRTVTKALEKKQR